MSDWVVESEVKTRLGHKILLAGLSEAGKTAVKQLYFNNTKLEELTGLHATLNYERLATTINGEPITILDLGGQRVFIKRFLSGFSPFVFSSVKGIIFLIDVSAKSTRNNSIQYFLECLKKLKHFSPKAQIFVFLHKTDLIKKSPNFNTVLQLIMEQFQVETDIRIRFFFTSIFEPDSVINSFIRIFDIILPNGIGTSEQTKKIEHYATVKFTSKNIENIESTEQTTVKEIEAPTIRSNRSNQIKFAGDLNILKDVQSLMRDSSKTEASISNEIDLVAEKPYETLSNLQMLIKGGMEKQIRENKPESQYLLKLDKVVEEVLVEPSDTQATRKEFLAKKLLSELQKDYESVDLSESSSSQAIDQTEIDPQELISISTKEEIRPKSGVSETTRTVESTELEPDQNLSKLYVDIDFEKKVKRIISFYGMKKDDAEQIVKRNYEDVIYELVAKSNIPLRVVLNVLLVNIPFLELEGYDISVLSSKKILEIFRAYLEGKIQEKRLFSILEKTVKHPTKHLNDLLM